MVGEVHDCFLVRFCNVFYFDDILIIEGVCNGHLQRSRISFFTIRADIRECHASLGFPRNFLSVPTGFIKAALSAMQMIDPIIQSKGIFNTIEAKTAIRNPIRIPSNDGPKVGIGPGHKVV